MSLKKLKTNKGILLLEVLIALGIFSVAIGAAFLLFFGGQSLSVDSLNSQRALEYAQESLEAVRSIRDRAWSELTDGQHGLSFTGSQWQFSGTSDSRNIFTRTVFISSLDDNTKQASTTITWQTDPVRTQTVVLVERLTNWRGPVSGGCVNDPLSGNWANPQVLGTADLGAGVSGTDVVVRLPYVFVSGTASSASKHDIFVYNVSNPSSPTLVKSLDIGSEGIEALYLRGDYLYAASSNDSKELIIFKNATNPVSLQEVGSYNMTGTFDVVSIITFASTTAVGRLDNATYELTFFNVSNPSIPTVISEIATGGDVNDFYADAKKLYAVSEESDEDIWIYDITNPLNPMFIASYDITGETEDLSIYAQIKNGATNLLVGNEQDELITIGATNTAQMYVRDRINLAGDVNDSICAKGDLVFLATGNSNKEFIIVNAQDPDNLTEYASLNFPQMASGIDYAENKVFVAVRSNDSLRIITSGP